MTQASKKISYLFFLMSCLIASAIGCTSSPDSGNKSATHTPQTEITISTVGETMMFDKNDVYVPSGENITLTFTNNASFLKHNILLVNPGKGDEVGMNAVKAGEQKGFIPDSPDVLAHSKLISKGSEVIKFKAPAPGDYPYICSFPGHYTVMKGVLHSIKK